MAVTELTFTKDWNNPTDFPTVETSELQVRADFQLLHDEAKDKINELIADHNDNISRGLTNAEIDAAIGGA